jgi:hypothetical protein
MLKDLDHDEGVIIIVKNSKKRIFVNKNILQQYVEQFNSIDYNKIRYFNKLDLLINEIK